MLCPWCGSPVMIRGSQWECGWCGDSGVLRRKSAQKPVQKPVQLTLRLSFVYHVELSETWLDLKEALAQLAPKKDTLRQLLGKVLLHHISAGIHHAGALPDEQKTEELRTFLNTTTDLNLGERAEQIMRDAGHGILFREEAALSERECGVFWTELFSVRPPEDYYNNVEPDGLDTLLSRLSSAYAYFSTKEDEETCDAQVYRNALQEAYYAQWQNHVLLHPDVNRAKRLLSEGCFPVNEDICREILLAEFPEEVPHGTAEELDDLSWAYILDDVFSRDAETGMTMWRFLLDIAEPALKSSPEAAGTQLRCQSRSENRLRRTLLSALRARAPASCSVRAKTCVFSCICAKKHNDPSVFLWFAPMEKAASGIDFSGRFCDNGGIEAQATDGTWSTTWEPDVIRTVDRLGKPALHGDLWRRVYPFFICFLQGGSHEKSSSYYGKRL